MRRRFGIVLSMGLWGWLAGCAVMENHSSTGRAHQAFVARSDYPETSEIYRDDRLLSKAASKGKKLVREVEVDLGEQRVRLLVNQLVAVDAPCCTGRAGKRTPKGVFPIKEKVQDKRSTIFGRLYRRGRQVYRGDRRRYRGAYDRYVGASLAYWMRLTDDGIGLHASHYVHRTPRSRGASACPTRRSGPSTVRWSPGLR